MAMEGPVPIGIIQVVVLAVLLLASPLQAAPLPTPKGKVILTVSGAIENTNADGVAEFDRNMLEALGMTQVRMQTQWTRGRPVFEGVLASVLLDAVGARGETARAAALNDYVVEIPLDDFRRYPVVVALKMDGQYLRVRDKGPIWIVYPHEQFAELQTIEIQTRWIWQLRRLEIR